MVVAVHSFYCHEALVDVQEGNVQRPPPKVKHEDVVDVWFLVETVGNGSGGGFF